MADRGKATPDLETLVASSYETRTGRICWGESIADKGLNEYITAIRQQMASGREPVWKRVAEIVEREFGHRHSSETVRKHVRGECKCPR